MDWRTRRPHPKVLKELGDLGIGYRHVSVASLPMNRDQTSISQRGDVLADGRGGEANKSTELRVRVRGSSHKRAEDPGPCLVRQCCAEACDRSGFGGHSPKIPASRFGASRSFITVRSAHMSTRSPDNSADLLRSEAFRVVAPVTGIAELDHVVSLMARFCDGPEHRDRRAVVVEALGRIDDEALLRRSHQEAAKLLAVDPDSDITALARRVILATLGTSLGFDTTADVVGAMLILSATLAPESGVMAPRAATVTRALEVALEGAPSDTLVGRANLVASLFQAVDATAGLVTNTLVAAAAAGSGSARDVPAMVVETLDCDPPVRCTRRMAAEPALSFANRSFELGELAIVPLTDRGLAFGTGPHECPGQRAARALATGIVEAVLAAGGVVTGAPTYEERSNLRIVAAQKLRRTEEERAT